MRRGSTSVITLTVPDCLDLTAYKTVYITFAQGTKRITKKSGDPGVTLEPRKAIVQLAQEDTLKFVTGPVEVQLRYITQDGRVEATEIAKTYNRNVLLEEVLL